MQQRFSICVNQYGLYCVPDEFSTRAVPNVLAKGEVYEPRTVQFIRENCGMGDVVSGGAFVGDFFPAISRALAREARLISFEPNPLCHDACLETMRLNRLRNIDLFPVAVGEKPGRMALQIRDFVKNEPAAAQSRLDPTADAAEEGYLEVEVTTIDALVGADREVSILHLDVEGFEAPAVLGAAETIRRCRPIIITEGGQVTQQWLREKFPGCRYRNAGGMERNRFFVPMR